MNNEITQAFLKMRKQITVCSNDKSVKMEDVHHKPKKRTPQKGSNFEDFMCKYEDIENCLEQFTLKDLVFFFRQKAEEVGVRYTISNMKRDMGIFKKLRENYSIEEILLMIEFIFSGEQTYLDIQRTQPTVLASNWVNTIYPDSKLWANDEYVDKRTITTKKDEKSVSKREWKSSKKKKIGEW